MLYNKQEKWPPVVFILPAGFLEFISVCGLGGVGHWTLIMLQRCLWAGIFLPPKLEITGHECEIA